MKRSLADTLALGGILLVFLAHLLILPWFGPWRRVLVNPWHERRRSCSRTLRQTLKDWPEVALNRTGNLYGALAHHCALSPKLNAAVYGHQGWLFLGDQYNRNFSQGLHRYLDPEARLTFLTAKTRRLAQLAQARGAKTLFLVAPSRTSLYPEFLPTPQPAGETLLTRWVAQCPELQVDILPALLAKKEAVALSSPYNTHWSDAAAGIVWDALRERLGQWWDIRQTWQAWGHPLALRWEQGDLADILRFRAPNPVPTLPLPKTVGSWQRDGEPKRTVNHPLILDATHGNPFVRHPNAPLNHTLLVIGDSNTVALSPYLNAAFATIHYRSFYVDYALPHGESTLAATLDSLHPDLVLWVIAERHLEWAFSPPIQ